MSKNTNLSFLTDYITADITNGRIGINNPSPTVAFDVTGAAKFSSSVTSGDLITASYGTARIQITSTTNSANAALRYTAKDSTGTSKNAGIYYVAGTTTANTFISLSSDDNAYLFNVLANGNVGIGTTSPASLLSIQRGASGDNMEIIGSGASGYSDILFYNTNKVTRLGYIDWSDTQVRWNVEANIPLLFYTNATERMRITSGGNVGIGRSNPDSYKLEVGGTVFANSFLSATSYSYPTVNVWTTFYTMASERGIYSVMIGLASESFAEWQSYGVVFCQGSTGVFSTLYNSSLVQMRLSGLNIQVLLAPGAGFTRELTFKVLRT
jgi:hypothetical protein